MGHPGGHNYFDILRLLIVFILTATMGVHSYYRHTQESIKAVSMRKLIYWLYSLAFLIACVTNFVLLALTIATKSYGEMPPHVGAFTILLVFSYLALLAGARKGPYK